MPYDGYLWRTARLTNNRSCQLLFCMCIYGCAHPCPAKHAHEYTAAYCMVRIGLTRKSIGPVRVSFWAGLNLAITINLGLFEILPDKKQAMEHITICLQMANGTQPSDAAREVLKKTTD